MISSSLGLRASVSGATRMLREVLTLDDSVRDPWPTGCIGFVHGSYIGFLWQSFGSRPGGVEALILRVIRASRDDGNDTRRTAVNERCRRQRIPLKSMGDAASDSRPKSPRVFVSVCGACSRFVGFSLSVFRIVMRSILGGFAARHARGMPVFLERVRRLCSRATWRRLRKCRLRYQRADSRSQCSQRLVQNFVVLRSSQ